jgi:hypothetical protein
MPRTLAALILLASVLAPCAAARADEPEERDDASSRDEEPAALSVISGRTLAKGRRVVTGSVGWPGVAIGGYGSPADAFDIGLMGRIAYGGPVMGFPVGLGFDLTVPMRVRLFHKGTTDMALDLSPRAFVGRAEMVGVRHDPEVEDDAGLGFGGEAGLRFGHLFLSKITLAWGVSGSVDYLMVPSTDAGNVVGTVTGMIGVETLFTRATLFYLRVEAGYGFAPDALFNTHAVFHGVVGFAHTRYD